MKDVRELAASSDALEGCARSARCAAFATAAACIAATQDKEALFANPLKMPSKSADPTGLLDQNTSRSCSHCIDACAQYLRCLAACEMMCEPCNTATLWAGHVQVHGPGCWMWTGHSDCLLSLTIEARLDGQRVASGK